MDTISRQQAIDVLHGYFDGMLETDTVCPADIYGLFKCIPSAQPEIIRCKDCKYYKYGICMKIGANKSFYGFCDWAERGEQE